MGESLHFGQDDEDNREGIVHDELNDVNDVDCSGPERNAQEMIEVSSLVWYCLTDLIANSCDDNRTPMQLEISPSSACLSHSSITFKLFATCTMLTLPTQSDRSCIFTTCQVN